MAILRARTRQKRAKVETFLIGVSSDRNVAGSPRRLGVPSLGAGKHVGRGTDAKRRRFPPVSASYA
jgi:hypothetical protein